MSDETCSICCDAEVDYKTDCNHNFCNTCITSWLLMNNNCPLCRNEFYDTGIEEVSREEVIVILTGLQRILYEIFLEERYIPKIFFVNPKLPNNINISYRRCRFRYDNNNFNNCESRY